MKISILLITTIVAVSANTRVRRQGQTAPTTTGNSQGGGLQNLLNLFLSPLTTLTNLGQQGSSSGTTGGTSSNNALSGLTEIPNQLINSFTSIFNGLPIIGGLLQTPSATGGTATYRSG